jgi:hypothetical protein
MKKVVYTENAPKPVGPYSQAIKADKFLFVSGQVAINPKEGKIIANSIKEQTIQVMEKHQSNTASRRIQLQQRYPIKRVPFLNEAVQRIQQRIRKIL